MSVILLILGLLLFVALVVVHELGHFVMARRNGVEVEEFGIGFPPRAKVLGRKNGTIYTLNWLPLGGFVRLKGEHDSDRTPGSFGSATLKAKTKIMIAGVVMNLVAAYMVLVFLALVGLPRIIDNQYTYNSDSKIIKNEVFAGYVDPGSPAEKAGLDVRDRIRSVGGITVTKIDALPEITKKYEGQKVSVVVNRKGKNIELSAQLLTTAEVEPSLKTDNPKGYLGISPTEYTLTRSTWSAPIVAAGLIKQFTILTFSGLGRAVNSLFHGNGSQAGAQVAGPVGIFVILKDGSELGYQFILMIIAIISLTLAIMNILPIPALDGGRLFITLLFRVLRRPLTKHREELIHGTGFAFLMLLFVVITIVDIGRNF